MIDIFERYGLVRVINATGTATRLGASPIDAEVITAMAAAAQCSVDMGELQGRASELIAEVTGAEAGIVTSGAMAGLLVGAAACMAGLDPVKMSQLPDTAGMRNEFIISRSHRNSYDHGVRAAGAHLVEVGLPDRLTGCGVRDTEVWEFASAIGDRTAGILYLARADARPALADVVRVAHAAKIPVMVDAAAELPPASNLRWFIEQGADLVAFSGGKGIRGPSGSGILCGRRDLIASALLQQLDLDFVYEDWNPPAQLIDKRALRGVPRHGIGRSCKAGKEQIVGLLTALLRFTQVDDGARNRHYAGITDSLVDALANLPALRVRTIADAGHGGMPLVEIVIAPGQHRPNALQVAARLRSARPAVYVDATDADQGTLILVPTCLGIDDAPAIGAAFAAALTPLA
ncbi:MAG: aminotransferase class V-fold PLP-dependent enzyme [Steroidobacteraceae bacterium]|jgi:D-glucosaminate-6-phosphate ammonia-lyase